MLLPPRFSHGFTPFSITKRCSFVTRLGISVCTPWSPTIQITTATNSRCQNGYVWHKATSFDDVCVIPDQYAQVADDNSQASTRLQFNVATGVQSCIAGYVRRQAFGGDNVCVTSDERFIIAEDSNTAITHIVTL
ncbi:MAG: hypothetical protein H0V70_22480 [Ktedonobacteraceae bacterium]|nr:hypothetical protein [Ktedonobacteraceae bacterium]